MAEDRAHDPARVPGPFFPGGSYEDKQAQRRFAAHGFNKGKAKDMNFMANAIKSAESVSGTARQNRRQHKSNLNVRGTTTDTQADQGPN